MLKLIFAVREFAGQMKKENISAFASSAAFFLFLSIVPMLIMICTIIPFTPLTEENLLTAVTDFTPDLMDPLVASLISDVYDKSAGILSVAALATLWSAGKGVQALVWGLNAVNDAEEERNFFLLRVISSLYTFVMLIVLILSLFIMVFGNQLVDLVLHRFPQIRILFEFLMHFRFLAVWLVLTILFAAVYAYVPAKKLHFKDQIPGATFTAVAWSIFSWCFSLYVSRGDSYSIYGSLSIIVIIMIWLYVCMYIMMIGAYLNRWWGEKNGLVGNLKSST